jgi:hypothetical protein
LNGAEERARVVGEFVLILEIENATRGVTIILNKPPDAPASADVPAATAPTVASPGAEERLRSESLAQGDEETDEKKLAAMPIEKLPRGVRLFVGILRKDYERRPKQPVGMWMPVPTLLGELQNKHYNEIPKDPKKPNRQLRTLERALRWLAVSDKDWWTDRTRTVD